MRMEHGGADLVVGLGEVVQSQDVVQEGAELRRKVLEHETVVVRLFQVSHLLLRTKRVAGKRELKGIQATRR